jgi:hypothetical protein
MALLLSLANTGCDKHRPGALDQNTPPHAARDLTGRHGDLSSQDRATRSGHDERWRAPAELRPEVPIAEIADRTLCVTKGKLERSTIVAPTFRAVAPAKHGDAMQLKMIVRESTEQRALASGQMRRQVGLKLRAADACNLVYAMWRLDPTPMLEVSTKINPGERNTSQCGTAGYTKVRPVFTAALPDLLDGKPHTLRAEIFGEAMTAWVDDTVAWAGTLPPAARELTGPGGLRSDNLEVEILGLAADERGNTKAFETCTNQHSD